MIILIPLGHENKKLNGEKGTIFWQFVAVTHANLMQYDNVLYNFVFVCSELWTVSSFYKTKKVSVYKQTHFSKHTFKLY